MPEDFDPIYDFQSLREYLIQNGFIVEQAHGYREIRPEVIDPMEAIRNGELDIRADGIFVVDPASREEQQVYLYKYDYHLERYGKPRFHICKCSKIQEFLDSGHFDAHYVRANSDPVPVRNIDNGYEEVMVDALPLCRYCMRMIREYGEIDTSQFVEILRQARGVEEDEPEVQEVDIFGYTRDWEQISKSYREGKNYTCERCGLQINNLFDRQYIHCHHRDRNKLNNNESNLECLCVKCHSEVDEAHKHNLTTGVNGIIFEAFMQKYGQQDINDDNDDDNDDDNENDDLPF